VSVFLYNITPGCQTVKDIRKINYTKKYNINQCNFYMLLIHGDSIQSHERIYIVNPEVPAEHRKQ
jgi:hypothetical protein